MRAPAFLAAAALSLAALTAGCGVTPGITNGAITECFKSLPPARAAIHDAKARLLGVHRLAADQFPRRLKSDTTIPIEQDTTVCAVAFKGTFSAGQVSGARSGSTGDYAVVLIDEKKLTVVAAYVGDHLPRNLEGRTV